MPTNAHPSLNAALSGRYTIERELGAGGMATVYLAHDTRHDRRVALKVLRPELSAILGAERFLAEIKTTANLQHPHILSLFDSGEADGTVFYVMPYVEGESLRDRIKREQQLPIDEAIRIAREVLDALQYAHDHGIVHRDIKPENILLHGGHAMVADFGIALAASKVDGGTRMTETGMSLGTPHYMSPEQAMGERVITGKADIYALGCVLYEMLTGEPPFTGQSAQAILARLLTDEPRSLTLQRKTIPQHVADAVHTALQKLPADRFASAAEFASVLAGNPFGSPRVVPAASTARVGARRGWSSLAVAVVGGVVLGAAALGLASRARPAPDRPPVHLLLDVRGTLPDFNRFTIGPNEDVFAFETDEGIAVRDPGQHELRVLAGTRGAEAPSFSPDGEWIVFHQNGRLRKIATKGGSAVALIPGDSLLSGRANWGRDGSIVFEANEGLYVIPAEGGSLRRLRTASAALSPRLLPDGSGVLYVDPQRGAKLMLYDFATDTAHAVLEESSEGQYVETGHIVYGHPNGGLFAVPFDAEKRRVTGSPIPVAADLVVSGFVSPFEIGRNGTLVYRAGVEPASRVLLRSNIGGIDTLPIAPRVISYLRFSPDGQSLAMTIGSARGTNRFTGVFDMRLGSLTPFTNDGGGHAPVWSPDGRRIAYSAEHPNADAEDLFVQPVDRSSPPVHVTRLPDDQHASAWPHDTMLVFSDAGSIRMTARAGGDISVVSPSRANATPRPYLHADWSEGDAAVSPDGRYAAFTSNESGGAEVYVRRFPDATAGGQLRVSANGGQRARWSADGRTVFYLATDGSAIHAAEVRLSPDMQVLRRRQVFASQGLGTAWDVGRSGRIAIAQAVQAEAPRLVAVVNWLDWLRRTSAR